MRTTGERIRKAEQAQALASSELYRDIREAAEAEIVGRWKLAQTVEERERCHAVLLGLQALDAELLTLINDGEMAKQDDRKARS